MFKCLLILLTFAFSTTSNADISMQQIAMQVNKDAAYQGSNIDNSVTTMPANQVNQQQAQSAQDYWELVLIFRSTCPYCQQFDPIITDFAKQSGFTLLAFSTDGGTLPGISNVLPATQAILSKFYPNKIPALYLVQKNTMQVIPISEGVIAEQDLAVRIQTVLSQEGTGQ